MNLKSIPALATAAATVAALVAAATLAIQSATAHTTPVFHAAAAKATTVSLRRTSLGRVLAGPNGHVLYLWEADSRNHSTCSGACAKAWPPLMLHGRLKAGSGVKAKLLGSTKRSGGRQVTYNGWPLYYFVGDSHAGQTTGQGSASFGAPWYVLTAAGKAIKKG